LRQQGSAILLISEDLDEIMSLSDRIGVMSEGAIVGMVEGQDADRELLGHWMTGTATQAA